MAAPRPSTSPGAYVCAIAPRSAALGALSQATTRAPLAAASSATSPKVSCSPGMTTQRAPAYALARRARSATKGWKDTRRARPSAFARRRSWSSAGPEPISRSGHGSSERAAASSSRKTPFSRASRPT